ncbi:MAG TPA: DEAD/DEAH box helicase [bacterium]|nr:DEAD/DEAH box helicase [bacterium]HNT66266.1 DEAD/DEAH box helicase [bacterium]HOX86803.1 DEAD/DEAH box helicase [bacterium]HPG46958.1 DEAD/DEAH box helicase [bacterium]HPM99322.1 DEAD/DEAH box helicase [bacterium]
MKLTHDQIIHFAGPAVFETGQRLYKQNCVKLTHVELDHFDAVVQDFQVRIRQTPAGLFALCTCPSWGNCEHSVAALLAAEDYYEKNRENLVQRRIHPSWHTFFTDLIEKNRQNRPNPTQPAHWKIIYTIKLELDGWSILPQKAYIKRNGEFGRVAPIGQFDTDNSDVDYQENDLFVISYLTRLNLKEQFSKWQTPSYYYDYRPAYYPYGIAIGHLFSRLLNSPLYMDDEGLVGEAITIAQEPARIEFNYTTVDDFLEIVPEITYGTERCRLGPELSILTENPIWILEKNRLFHIENLNNADALMPFAQERLKIRIPRTEFTDFVTQAFPSLAEFLPLSLPDIYRVVTIDHLNDKKLIFSDNETHLAVKLQLGYDGQWVDYNDPQSQKIVPGEDEKSLIRVIRQKQQEDEIANQLMATGLKRETDAFHLPLNRAMNWMSTNLPEMVARNFAVEGLDHLRKFHIRTADPHVKMQVSTEIDWFDLNLEISIEGIPLSLLALRRAFRQNQPYLKLHDGSLAILPVSWMKRYAHLFNFAQVEQDRIRLQQHHLTLIDILFDEADISTADHAFEIRRDILRNFSRIEPHPLPPSMEEVLRPYQKSGYDWLNFLKTFQFGGCLADDMGLGKTVQTLALLLNEKNSSKKRLTSLIICPTSVVFNWQQEVNKFAPSLEVLAHVGLDRAADTDSFQQYDIILSTYGIMRRDIASLRNFSFHFIILDESQKIKNANSQTAKAARLLNGRYRLALTGTPIENNTQELWSQFAFLNPGLLGSLTYFKRNFVHPIEKEEDQETVGLLQKMVFPFILRRSKENVAMDLPPKTEQTVLCAMNQRQTQMYNLWRDHYRALLLKKIDEQGMDKARINILEGLVRLRQIACHPYLIDPQIHEDSGKYEHLKEFVEEILAENHKILIFSQFVKMLKLIRSYFDKEGITYEYLDGHTVNRERVIRRFQENRSIQTFLISLKAGGTGLNLTAADYVILYDPWWNPAVEMQAMDRAHRIGQDKNVFVYRLITKDSVEEKMLLLQEKKKKLVSNLIVTDKSFFKSLSRNDIETLFS